MFLYQNKLRINPSRVEKRMGTGKFLVMLKCTIMNGQTYASKLDFMLGLLAPSNLLLVRFEDAR